MLDVLVIGGGFGGLATALSLADGGAQVALCETLKYPGGCASTFQRAGYQFEAGATLFSGFDPGQLFGRFIERYALPVETRAIDPVVDLRAPGLRLEVPPRREQLIERLCAFPDAPAAAIRAFFARQKRAADALWALFDDPRLLPPFGPRALLRHLASAPRLLPLLGLVGQPLGKILGPLHSFAPLRIYLDAVCQITVQTSAREAEAPFAMAAMDYYFRGTRHVRGGIGELAWALARAIEARGGEVRLADRALRIERIREGFRVHSRRGMLEARQVVCNLLPQSVGALLGTSPVLDALSRKVQQGWGAAMLYLAVDSAGLRPEAHHLELIDDPEAPFTEGNHLFCSLSAEDETARAPAGQRTVTVSTHLPLAALRALPEAGRVARIAQAQSRMETTLARLAPELRVRFRMTASPRTFERFTGRFGGYVGGIPRRAGLSHYRQLLPQQPLPGVWLVGDSLFPGQSTLAAALGGVKLAERLLRR